MARQVELNEATAARLRVYFHCVDVADGITAELGEAGGQPEVSTNGGAWTGAAAIGVLVAIGSGRYYAELTAASVNTTGDLLETHYKSAATAESVGDSIEIVTHDPVADIAAILVDVTGINGDVMRGTDGVSLVVPDAAGVAPTANEVRDAIIDDATRFSGADVGAILVDTTAIIVDTTAIIVDVTGINGDVMRGTDGVSLVIPDAVGTAAGLHGVTDGLIGGLVVPDAAGIAAGLHGITDGLIGAVQVDTTAIIVDTTAIIVDTTAIIVDTTAIIVDTTQLLVDSAAIIADTTAIIAAIGLQDTELGKILGAAAGKCFLRADGDQIKWYTFAGALLSTLDWNAGTTTWDVTWA